MACNAGIRVKFNLKHFGNNDKNHLLEDRIHVPIALLSRKNYSDARRPLIRDFANYFVYEVVFQ